MKVLFCGVNCRTGVSEKTQRSYTIAELLYLVPDQNAEKNHDDGTVIWRYVAFGYKVRTLPVDASCISTFSNCKPLTEIDVRLEPIPEAPSKNQVTGLA